VAYQDDGLTVVKYTPAAAASLKSYRTQKLVDARDKPISEADNSALIPPKSMMSG